MFGLLGQTWPGISPIAHHQQPVLHDLSQISACHLAQHPPFLVFSSTSILVDGSSTAKRSPLASASSCTTDSASAARRHVNTNIVQPASASRAVLTVSPPLRALTTTVVVADRRPLRYAQRQQPRFVGYPACPAGLADPAPAHPARLDRDPAVPTSVHQRFAIRSASARGTEHLLGQPPPFQFSSPNRQSAIAPSVLAIHVLLRL